MTLDNLKILARTISGIASEQDTIKQNLSGTEQESQLVANFNFNVVASGIFTATKFLYATDSFIIDHPIQGEINSSVYKLDGGYQNAGAPFPLTFPISFTGTGVLLYSTTF